MVPACYKPIDTLYLSNRTRTAHRSSTAAVHTDGHGQNGQRRRRATSQQAQVLSCRGHMSWLAVHCWTIASACNSSSRDMTTCYSASIHMPASLASLLHPPELSRSLGGGTWPASAARTRCHSSLTPAAPSCRPHTDHPQAQLHSCSPQYPQHARSLICR